MGIPALAVSLGDPAGVGPELIGAAWALRNSAALPPFFAVGGAQLLAAAGKTRGLTLPIEIIADPAEASVVFPRALPVLGHDDAPYCPGAPDKDGARLALGSLRKAAQLAVAGQAAGVVTGPIAKARLAEVGFTFPGQTEFVAHASGTAAENAVMLLAGPNLRTVPLTVHCSLASVPGQISIDLICNRSRITAASLQRDFGIANPRLAICALNPHAGEDGRFGDEEQRIIAPAIALLRAEGIDATGPHPADSLFSPHARDSFDVALCMYHDQALIPLKALDFDNGVNMTLGLPIVRTSPDHGTAFAIAGKGLANPGATLAAIRMAGDAAMRRRSKSA
ncbi:4-hydroxythreonine-4-phosphate dehydrogenase [Caenibius tardaugens NBRC 16725]|uniref:4-hydroxythreonine-4-phosphate dehydrogenase n=1 Tax=Caenibius tardaugens NBRC 16725 TaxID=1219035 RepID=U2Y356_9SPHN|nr:4-hydroxythreonine-4-phosphate dehydrogenase PdxA [Caenibius tardaugens]AZI37369.1 4-hydroxythreonine-4-phosphate dehydrogenase PdxA [Caenibius tardaugens NBRC 16725]GAD47371.1 4-hydroxythreonine-4-phosphate dehydrogenase [Caenibius tardaugens NBRC 16725]